MTERKIDTSSDTVAKIVKQMETSGTTGNGIAHLLYALARERDDFKERYEAYSFAVVVLSGEIQRLKP